MERGHAALDFVVRGTGQVGERHGRHAVLYVDADGHAQLYVADARVGRHEIDVYFAVAYADVLGMVVALVARVGPHADAGLYVRAECQSLVHQQRAAGADEGGVVPEALQVGLGRAVDVQVVGVGGGDDAHPRAELVERAVEFVGLDDGVGTFSRQQQVGAVVLGDATQKGRTAHVRLMQQVGQHGARGGLAMRAGHAQGLAAARDEAQHLRAFVYLETSVAEVFQFGMRLGHGGCVDHQRGARVAAFLWDERHVFLVVYLCALLAEALGQFAGRAVVSGHVLAFGEEVTYQRAHAYAARADEVNGLYVFYVHHCILVLQIELSIVVMKPHAKSPSEGHICRPYSQHVACLLATCCVRARNTLRPRSVHVAGKALERADVIYCMSA